MELVVDEFFSCSKAVKLHELVLVLLERLNRSGVEEELLVVSGACSGRLPKWLKLKWKLHIDVRMEGRALK